MARLAVVQVEGQAKTWTVVGSDHLPIAPVEEYMEYLRLGRFAARTVKHYARSLKDFFNFLDLMGIRWDQIETLTFGGYLRWLRTGLLPSVTVLGPETAVRKESSVATYSAAVLAFYRFQLDAHDVQAARKLYRQRPARVSPQKHSNYRPRLHGIAKPRPVDVPIYRLDAWQRRPTPVLTPEQVGLIMAACGGNPAVPGVPLVQLRDRLLLETLSETGMRIGETLALKHQDWVVGAGRTPFIEVVPRDDHPHGYTVKRSRPRRVYISDRLAGIYGEYVWRLCERGAADVHDPLDQWWAFVNCTTRGVLFAPMQMHTVTMKITNIKAKLDDSVPTGWSPHWFRHTHATTLLLAGVPPHVVMRRLGHQDVQTTLETYGWVTEDAELKLLADWRSAATSWAVEPARIS